MSVDIHVAADLFEQRFNRPAQFAGRAPGRVNIIGEHTDYNHGFVLPMAIERDTVIVCAPRDDSAFSLFSANFDQQTNIDLNNPLRSEECPWSDYVSGVAAMLKDSGRDLRGADALILGDVPFGRGLSSSASLEMAAVCMFQGLGGFKLEGTGAAELCLKVENEFLGLATGIMDQFISSLARKDHALFVDCRTLDCEHVPIHLPDAQFVIADTGVARSLTDSKYNERVAECGSAVAQLNKALNTDATHLRYFEITQLFHAKDNLGDIEYHRARHVITENERTRNARDALRNGDHVELGVLMNASDTSLDEDYRVSCDELRTMTRIARSLEGCCGSRMTGAGFGGCTVSLVARNDVDAFSAALRRRYDEETGLACEIIVSSPAAGAETIALTWA